MSYNLLICEKTNVYKFTDHENPIFYQKSDYRTSSSRALPPKHSSSRNFLPDSNSENLCNLIKSETPFRYNPKSETTKEFQWKVEFFIQINYFSSLI